MAPDGVDEVDQPPMQTWPLWVSLVCILLIIYMRKFRSEAEVLIAEVVRCLWQKCTFVP